MKTISDVIQDLQQDIERVENATIAPNLYVVIWESYRLADNDPLNVTYALCNKVVNGIAKAEAQDTTPWPSLSLVRLMSYDEADRIARERPVLYNGRDDVFRSTMLKATTYRQLLLDELHRQKNSIEGFVLRHS